MIPMNRIRHQLRAWLAGKMKMCLRKNVFNSVSCKKNKIHTKTGENNYMNTVSGDIRQLHCL